jgi:hypothetical protein
MADFFVSPLCLTGLVVVVVIALAVVIGHGLFDSIFRKDKDK